MLELGAVVIANQCSEENEACSMIVEDDLIKNEKMKTLAILNCTGWI